MRLAHFTKTKFEKPVRHLDQYLSNFCQTRANFTGFAGMSDTFRHLWISSKIPRKKVRKRNQKYRDDIKVKAKRESKFKEAFRKKESERKRVQYIKRKREASLNEKRILNTKEESRTSKRIKTMSGQRKGRLREKANDKAYERRQANKTKKEMNRLRVALFRSQNSSLKSDDNSNSVKKSKSERTIRYLKRKAEAVQTNTFA